MEADKPSYQLQDEQLVLKVEPVLCVLQVFLEKLLGKPLGVVDEVERGEVEGMWCGFLPLLPF